VLKIQVFCDMMLQLVPLDMMSYLRSFSFTNTLWEPRILYI